MKYHTVLFSKIGKDVAKCVVCCSRGLSITLCKSRFDFHYCRQLVGLFVLMPCVFQSCRWYETTTASGIYRNIGNAYSLRNIQTKANVMHFRVVGDIFHRKKI